MLKKIISGGQTGADRAALDVALLNNIPIGGSCPKGRLAEDGPLAPHYVLEEISSGYRARTRKNVEDADGTLIFYQRYLQGGTEQTLAFCIKADKPYKLIDIELIEPECAANLLVAFLEDFQIMTLNVAGPRHSACPDVYDFVRSTFGAFINHSYDSISNDNAQKIG